MEVGCWLGGGELGSTLTVGERLKMAVVEEDLVIFDFWFLPEAGMGIEGTEESPDMARGVAGGDGGETGMKPEK